MKSGSIASPGTRANRATGAWLLSDIAALASQVMVVAELMRLRPCDEEPKGLVDLDCPADTRHAALRVALISDGEAIGCVRHPLWHGRLAQRIDRGSQPLRATG